MAVPFIKVGSHAVGTFLSLVATTTLVKRVYGKSAAGRVEALEELYKMVQGRHEQFVREILPRLTELGKNDDAFLGADATKRALEA